MDSIRRCDIARLSGETKHYTKEECDFCSRTQEWEDGENNFFMEFRTDTPWHTLHICLGHDSRHENDIELDFKFCPMCGRKLI